MNKLLTAFLCLITIIFSSGCTLTDYFFGKKQSNDARNAYTRVDYTVQAGEKVVISVPTKEGEKWWLQANKPENVDCIGITSGTTIGESGQLEKVTIFTFLAKNEKSDVYSLISRLPEGHIVRGVDVVFNYLQVIGTDKPNVVNNPEGVTAISKGEPSTGQKKEN